MLKFLINQVKIYFLLYLAMLVARLFFMLYNHQLFSDFFSDFIQCSYYGFRLDMSSIAYLFYPILLFQLIQFKFKINAIWIRIFVGILLFILFLPYLIDSELFSKWGNKINSQVFVYINHPKEMALSAGATPWLKLLGLSAGFIVVLFFIGKFMNQIWTKKLTYEKRHLWLLILLLALNFIPLRGSFGVAAINQSSAYFSNKNQNNAAAVNSFWNAFYYLAQGSDNFYNKQYQPFNDSDKNQYLAEQINQSNDSLQLFKTTKPNVIIVMLESFTSYASKYFGGVNNCTPHLDKIAQESFCFTNCIASGDRTEKGLVSVLSGYPAQPLTSIIVFPDKVRTLPCISKDLKKAGYYSVFNYASDAEFASMKSYLVMNEFDEIKDKKSYSFAELNSKWGAHDEVLYNKSIANMSELKQPFLNVIMTLSSHEPFDVPYQSKTLVKDEWYLFKNSIEYADYCLNKFINDCKKQKWYDNTIIVLVADHGHDIGIKNTHFFGLDKFKIPLVITGGALNPELKGKQHKKVVSQTIIPKLVLSSMKLDTKEYYWQNNTNIKNHQVHYFFNNGFGSVSDSAELIFDNVSGKCYHYTGKPKDSLNRIKKAIAFQQYLTEDYNKR